MSRGTLYFLLDKTGTITHGNRQAVAFVPVGGHSERKLAAAALLVPLPLKGAKFRPMPSEKLLIYNLMVYGVGGSIVPLIGIKTIYLGLGLFI